MAMGEGGCRTPDEWHGRYRPLLPLLHDDGDIYRGGDGDIGDDDGRIYHANDGIVPATTPAADFGEALRSLDERECYRARLWNALDALDESSSLTTTTTTMTTTTWKTATTSLRTMNDDRDDDGDDDGGGLRLSV